MNRNLLFIIIVSFFIAINFIFNQAPKIYYNFGLNAMKKQNYVLAAKHFRKALLLKKNESEYKYGYVQALSKLKPNYYVQKEIFTFANDNNKDSAQQLAEFTVKDWQTKIFNSIGNNYIEQAPSKDEIVRWDIKKFPLKIYTINESGKELPPYYIQEINNALAQWQNSSAFIKFTVTNIPKEANIIIKILPLPENVCEKGKCLYTVGFTEPDIKGKKLIRMTIVLYSNDPLGNWFSDKELYNTVLHELGHALGIMGHSYNSGDLMYMSNKGNQNYIQYRSDFQYLSAKDVSTIKLLYKLAPDITNSDDINTENLIYPPVVLGSSQDMLTRKLNEALNYIKAAPNIPNGYVDLGLVYVDMNKMNDAIKAFEKAYRLAKSNSDKYIASYNIAITYFDMSKFNKAEKYAQIAKQISNTDEIQKLLTEINLHKKN